MSYSVKEIFYTMQGEGAQSGRPAVFCRFAGCNLWSGREKDRATAICRFCDTDFVGVDGDNGGRFDTAESFATAVRAQWKSNDPTVKPLVVCTGGEPLLQLDTVAVKALQDLGFEVAVETNGTQSAPKNIDWICMSPKAGTKIVLTEGDELKLVFPQPDLQPSSVEHLQFKNWFLQPMDGPERDKNVQLTLQYCLAHPRWRLSLQMHKLVGIR
jgi:7-carboxy-7-deazaguanine synthase